MKRTLLLAVVLSLAGCASRVANVTSLPAGVTVQEAKRWDAAVADLHKIALTTSFLRQALIDVCGSQSAVIPASSGQTPQPACDRTAYGLALQTVGKIDELQLSAGQALRQQPQHWGVSNKVVIAQYAQEILGQIQQLNSAGLTGIKNPASLKKINGLVAELQGAAKLVAALAA